MLPGCYLGYSKNCDVRIGISVCGFMVTVWNDRVAVEIVLATHQSQQYK